MGGDALSKRFQARAGESPAGAALDELPFLWGAATSAHQVEGADEASDWHDWETAAGSPCVEPCGIACDHLHRYPEDIALLASLGLNSYRFSVEWSRIEPRPGGVAARWLEHYRSMLECCRANGLMAVLTLHHFTNPKWIADWGGWENRDTAQRFADYCGVVVRELGDLVAVAITINEPNIPALLGYELGWFPPGKHDHRARLRASEVFIEAHRLARLAIRAARPSLPVGIALAMADWQAQPGGGRELSEVRRLREDIFLEATDGDDFLGVNTYTRHRIGPDGWVECDPRVELTAAGYEFWPEALEATLRRAWKLTGGRPLIVTESGIATDDDSRRVEYIERAHAAMQRAVVRGVDMRGFIYWSALDNFEWQHGYAQRFGIVSVDRQTLKRTARPSAQRLGELARTGASSKRPIRSRPGSGAPR